MFNEKSGIKEAFSLAMDLGANPQSGMGMIGYGIVTLRDADGILKSIDPFANRITTTGDQYYATRGAAGIGTPNIAQPTLVTGMKLGTGATAAAKSSTNAFLGAYITGSNKIFDTTHPTLVDEAGDTGWSIVYKVTWPAGTVTNSAITEAVIVNNAGTDATSNEAATISRVVFTAKNKTVDDTLAITWSHTFLGA
jgi:hypothetical protein